MDTNLKKPLALSALLLCALVLAGCTPKLATVRPAEVSELRVERLSDGAVSPFDETMQVAEKLIFQLEEPYTATGACSESDGHKYRVTLYLGVEEKKIDTEVFINEDGSVCRRGRRYVPSDMADKSVNVADYDALFEADAAPGKEQTDAAQELPAQAPVADEPDAHETLSGETVMTGSMEVTAAQGTLAELPEGISLFAENAAAEAGGWSYSVCEAEYDGQKFALLLRRQAGTADARWIAAIPQPMDETGLSHEITYEGGAKESGGQFLYFTLRDAEDYHRSLWIFDTATLYFNRMYDVPCSNMVIPEEPGPDYAGLGWIIYEYYLIPVELETASEYTGGVIDLEEYYAAADEELFRSIGDWGTHKYVRLTDLGGSALGIEGILAQPETGAEERIESLHQIDCATLKFD